MCLCEYHWQQSSESSGNGCQFCKSISFYNLWPILYLSVFLIMERLSCCSETLWERGCLGHCPWRIELLVNYRPLFQLITLTSMALTNRRLDLTASAQRRSSAFKNKVNPRTKERAFICFFSLRYYWMNETEINRELNKTASMCNHHWAILIFARRSYSTLPLSHSRLHLRSPRSVGNRA